MKKFFYFIPLLLVLLTGCTIERPEPPYDPNAAYPERTQIGSEVSGNLTYSLYSDNTAEVSLLDEDFRGTSLVIADQIEKYTVVAIEPECFRNKTLLEIVLPKTLKRIETRAFQRCTIQKIHFPASLEFIGVEAFDNCIQLETVTFEEGTSALKEIPLGAFYGCQNLKKLTLPEGVEIIGEEAFGSLHSLEALSLPSTLKEIGPYAFWNCGTDSLSIQIPAGTEKIGTGAFDSTQWLESKTDEWVVVGNHILLRYNGYSSSPTVLDHIRYLSGAFEKSSATELSLPKNLAGICPLALENTSIRTVRYEGTNGEILSFLKTLGKQSS